jgi:hypothetical protein
LLISSYWHSSIIWLIHHSIVLLEVRLLWWHILIWRNSWWILRSKSWLLLRYLSTSICFIMNKCAPCFLFASLRTMKIFTGNSFKFLHFYCSHHILCLHLIVLHHLYLLRCHLRC